MRAIRLARHAVAGASAGAHSPEEGAADSSPDRPPFAIPKGAILAHDLRDEHGRVLVAKGTRLHASDAGAAAVTESVADAAADAAAPHPLHALHSLHAVLHAAVWQELHLLVPEADDVHEAEAGARLAHAAAGGGVEVGRMTGGAWPLCAAQRGILMVQRGALDAVNEVEGLSVYTLFDGQVVEAGETVARAKIVPFVVSLSTLARGEAAARQAGGVVHVRPFRPATVGAVVQESLGAPAMARFEAALGEKVRWFGSSLLAPAFVVPDPAAIAAGIERLVARGASIIALAGSRPMDPLDPVYEALIRAGATMERQGVPAHPGSLVWLARRGDVVILGMPACGLFSQATVFDLLLPRLLTGERLTARDLAALGHGGFLTRDMAFRFPPYRVSRDRGAVEET